MFVPARKNYVLVASIFHRRNNDVVAVPRDLHLIYSATWISLDGHRFMLDQIIKQLYGCE